MFPDRDLWIEADLRWLREARGWAERAAADFGFPSEGCYQVKLAMSEAVANAIQHGSATTEDPIHITAKARDAALVFEVRDTGVFREPEEPTEMSERGRGLALVGLIMDEVELSPAERGSVLRFVKRLDSTGS